MMESRGGRGSNPITGCDVTSCREEEERGEGCTPPGPNAEARRWLDLLGRPWSWEKQQPQPSLPAHAAACLILRTPRKLHAEGGCFEVMQMFPFWWLWSETCPASACVARTQVPPLCRQRHHLHPHGALTRGRAAVASFISERMTCR